MNSGENKDVTMEQVEQMNTDQTQTNGSSNFKSKFMDGRVRKKKPLNSRLQVRKYVLPKPALQSINEACSKTITYKIISSENPINEERFCVSAEVNGRNFIGRGPSIDKAKAEAAEAALASLVVPSGSDSLDITPWSSIASFAVFKLFSEWSRGKIWNREAVLPYDIKSDEGTMEQAILSHVNCNPNFKGLMGSPKHKKEKAVNKEKALPANAAEMNPVMLLNQMRPGIEYVLKEKTMASNNAFTFTIHIEVEGKEFYGQGSNLKKAKLDAATKAVKVVFNIDTLYKGSS